MFEDEDHQIRPKISYRTSLDFDTCVLKAIEPNILENKLTVMPIKTMTKGKNGSMGVSLTTSKHSTSTKSKSSFSRGGRSSSMTYGKKKN